MHAKVGDWLILKTRAGDTHVRRAAILGVQADGSPPYTVRWMDDDREAIVFPGDDAEVVSAEAQAEADRIQSEQIEHIQSEIAAERQRA
jgi:Domain of unknown function (DUF1918)